MTERAFEAEVLAELRRKEEIVVETRPSPDGPAHRTIIWIVVDERDRVLVRSVRGPGARWYREATRAGSAVLLVGGTRISVRATPASDEDRVAACSLALRAKYAGDPALPSMLRDEVLDTTLELRPA